MSAFASRIVVALVLLPLVLGVVWLGGWWLFALAAIGGLIALHELYTMGRGLRPIVLARLRRAPAHARRCRDRGSIAWMVGGIFATILVAFVIFGFSDARPSATAAISLTLLGVVWIGGGISALLLLREIPENGRLVIFTVLIAVFADDTAAYRRRARHRPSQDGAADLAGQVVGGVRRRHDRGDGGCLLRDVRPGLSSRTSRLWRSAQLSPSRRRSAISSSRRSSATSASRTRVASSRATVACSIGSIRSSGRAPRPSTSSSR